ncbi:thermonuclease family protein [uncultured Sneathiella sp.]|uniref:thermonuclease family protein n=1 Tax=uncultured Sneathiella sp. TaxID=879315 RepID=UPI0025966EC7|nr:thermonuclease family protein [uncultured Sneathiella sp.]
MIAVLIVVGVLGALYPTFKALLDANVDKSGMLTGAVTVTDGDTIRLGNTKIRLHGIDAPESRQNCYSASETLYPCGSKSTAYLRRLVGSKQVYCDGQSKDRYGRLIAVCYAGDKNLNAEMVRSGWATAYSYYSKSYVIHELIARILNLGIWEGQFMEPYKWRKATGH